VEQRTLSVKHLQYTPHTHTFTAKRGGGVLVILLTMMSITLICDINIRVMILFVLCVEVLECRYRNGGCVQYCRDLTGGAGVQCGCTDGFKLEPDGQSCSATGNTQINTVTTVTTAHYTMVYTVTIARYTTVTSVTTACYTTVTTVTTARYTMVTTVTTSRYNTVTNVTTACSTTFNYCNCCTL